MNKNTVFLVFAMLFVGAGSYFTYTHFRKKTPSQFNNKFILFDFDGTLVDSAHELINAANQTLTEYGYEAGLTYPELRKTLLSDSLKQRGISFWRIPFLQKRALVIMSEHLDAINPFIGTREFLLALKAQGFNLGILTSNKKENVEYILRKHNLELFDKADIANISERIEKNVVEYLKTV
jgi:phosphoglycolate phosphatase